jgi:FkbM family methyltransferase
LQLNTKIFKEIITDTLTKPSAWDVLKETEKPIVLYGTGDGADMVLDEFEQRGISAAAVAVSDDFARDKTFRGFKIMKLSEVENSFDDFIMAICFGTHSNDVMEAIQQVAQKHTVIYPCKPVCGNNCFDKKFVKTNYGKLAKAHSALADETSRRVFQNIVLFQYTGLLRYLFAAETSKTTVFDILNLGQNEHYLDAGAYRGDTVEEFLSATGGKYAEILALEPNQSSFKKLQTHCAKLQNATVLNAALYGSNTTLQFYKATGRGYTMSQPPAANSKPSAKEKNTKKYALVQAVTADSLCTERKITYLKMDIEGAEAAALAGAENLLKTQKPKLNIAGYHRFEDIFEIPLLIKSINPSYKIFLRHHHCIPAWDTNFYCV